LRLPNFKKKYNLNQKVYILKDLDVVRRKNEDMMCITMEMPQYQQVQNKKQKESIIHYLSCIFNFAYIYDLKQVNAHSYFITQRY